MCNQCRKLQLKPEIQQLLQSETYTEMYPEYETGWWDTAKNYTGNFVSPFFNWASGWVNPAPQPAAPASSETAVIKAAIAAGTTNENDLANLIFYRRHPELNNQPLTSSQPGFKTLSAEWITIRDTLVRPVLSNPAGPAPAAPASGNTTNWAALPESSRMLYVMEKLVQQYGFPVNGAAGIVGNLKAESGIIPNRIEGSKSTTPMTAKNFSGATVTFSATEVMNRNSTSKYGPLLPGAGLAQWTSSSRRIGLFKHAYGGQVIGANIMYNMDAQIDYLVYELKTSYKNVYKLIANAAVSVNDATDEVVYNFERPGSIFVPGSNYKTVLPRSDNRVQTVFAERRKNARQALAAYKTKHP